MGKVGNVSATNFGRKGGEGPATYNALHPYLKIKTYAN